MSEAANKKMKSPKTAAGESEVAVKSPLKVEDVDVPALNETSKASLTRVNALKNLQVKLLEVEAKFYEDLHELECKYAQLYEPFYEKRRQIIAGEYEPTVEEGKWAQDELNDDDEHETNGKKEGVDEKSLTPSGQQLLKELKSQFDKKLDEKGLANFWFETLQSFRITAEIIQEHDEPILAYLQDIRVRLFDKKPYGYTLEFHFGENPYFTNKVLTKTYTLKTEVDPKDPFSFDGPDLDKATGCKIDWKQGQNVTVKLVKKKLKPRNKKAGAPKIITKEEKQDSFFNFFETPKVSEKKSKSPASSGAEDGGKKDKQVALRSKSEDEDDDEDDEENEAELYLIADFEIGQYIKEKIVPKAILYYTGEDIDDEYDDYEDEEDEDDEDDDENDDDDDDDDEEDDDDDDDDHGKKGKGGKKQLAIQGKPGKNNKHAPKGGAGGEPTPSECKQN